MTTISESREMNYRYYSRDYHSHHFRESKEMKLRENPNKDLKESQDSREDTKSADKNEKNEIDQFVLNTRLRTVNVPYSRIHHTTTCHQNTLYCFSGLRSVRSPIEQSSDSLNENKMDSRQGQCIRDCHQLHFRKTFPWKKMADKGSDFPSERFSHVMWSRTKTKSLWIAGGLDQDLNILNDVWCINNSTNGEWRLVARNIPASIFSCTVLYHKHNDNALFYGIRGFYSLNFPPPDVELISESMINQSWKTLDPIPGEFPYRTGHTSQWMQKNQMIIFGGESFKSNEPQTPPNIYLDAITETTGWLSDAGPSSFKNSRHNYSLQNRVVLNDIWVYNIVTMKWECLQQSTHRSHTRNSNIPSPRAHHTSCVVKRNLYIYGGLTIQNGHVSAVEDMDVVWCLDLYKLSMRSDMNPVDMSSLWRKIEIKADRFIPRSVVGFSMDLIARKDKAVAFIGFGGYDLEQKKAVNRMFTLIDSNYAHIDFYTQSKQRSEGSLNGNDEACDSNGGSPCDDMDLRQPTGIPQINTRVEKVEGEESESGPQPRIEDSGSPFGNTHALKTSPLGNTSIFHRSPSSHSMFHGMNQSPQHQEPLSHSYSLHSNISSQIHQNGLLSGHQSYSPSPLGQSSPSNQSNQSSQSNHSGSQKSLQNIQLMPHSNNSLGHSTIPGTLQHSPTSDSDSIFRIPDGDNTFPMRSDPLPFDSWNQLGSSNSSYSLFSSDIRVFNQGMRNDVDDCAGFSNISQANQIQELQREILLLKERLVQQQQRHIQETQFRELDFQTRVRSATNMRFKLLASEAFEMSSDVLIQVKKDLEASLEVVNHQLDQSFLCTLCKHNRRSVLFFPCTHVKVCESCSKDAIRCPTCSTVIESKYRVTL